MQFDSYFKSCRWSTHNNLQISAPSAYRRQCIYQTALRVHMQYQSLNFWDGQTDNFVVAQSRAASAMLSATKMYLSEYTNRLSLLPSVGR